MPLIAVISFKAPLTVCSLLEFNLSKSDEPVDFIRGTAVEKIKIAMMIDATGSNPCHLNNFVRIVEITTPTDPNVSAKM